jgi:Plavaka transposase
LPVDIDDQSREAREENPYAPFDNAGQWDLVYSCLYPERLSNKRIKRIVVNKYNRALEGSGFTSLKDFDKRVKLLSSKGVPFRTWNIKPGSSAPKWAPQLMEVWMRDTLDVVKRLVGNPRWANDMKWAPEEAYNENKERIYSELWTGNWWKRMQVYLLFNRSF